MIEGEVSLQSAEYDGETKLSDGEALLKTGDQIVGSRSAIALYNAGEDGRHQQRVSKTEECKRGSDNQNVERHRETDHDSTTLEDFRPVIEALSLPALTRLALAIRKRYTSNANGAQRITRCKVSENPRFGSYNLVYFLTFNDGVKWVARLPGYGVDPSQLQAEKIEAE